jgi:hypothetical protein
MTVKDLKKLLDNHPDEFEVILKDYNRGDDLWVPKPVKYCERLKSEDKILIA